MIEHMKQLLIEIEDDVAAKLEQVAPGRSRRRSAFIRDAIRRALWEIEETATAEAYRRLPDSAADVYFDPKVWEVRDAPARASGRRRARR
jgi:predicted transcriptional regulator